MELIYERYKSDPYSIMEKDGIQYHKAVHIDELQLKTRNMVLVTLPWKMFGEGKAISVRESNGTMFQLGGPVLLSFKDHIPEWYFECGTFEVKNAETKNDLGKFFTNSPYMMEDG